MAEIRSKRLQKQARPSLWPVLMAVIVVGALLAFVERAAVTWTPAVVTALIVALAAWIFWGMSFARNAALSIRVAVLGLLAATALLTGLLPVRFNREQSRVALGELRSTAAAASRGAVSDAPKAKGQMGQVEAMLLEYMRETQALSASYSNDIKATGVLAALSPARLASDPQLRRALASMAAARELVKTYHARNLALVDDLPNKILELDVDPATQSDAFQGLALKEDELKANIEKAWAFETETLDEIEAAARVLQSHPGRWEIQRGQLVFADQATQAEYNGHVRRAMALSRQEQEFRNSLIFGNGPRQVS